MTVVVDYPVLAECVGVPGPLGASAGKGWGLPHQVVAIALAASDMPELAPDEDGEYPVAALIGRIDIWVRQGLERLGGERAAFACARRSIELHRAGVWDDDACRLYRRLWGEEERYIQAGSLADQALVHLGCDKATQVTSAALSRDPRGRPATAPRPPTGMTAAERADVLNQISELRASVNRLSQRMERLEVLRRRQPAQSRPAGTPENNGGR